MGGESPRGGNVSGWKTASKKERMQGMAKVNGFVLVSECLRWVVTVLVVCGDVWCVVVLSVVIDVSEWKGVGATVHPSFPPFLPSFISFLLSFLPSGKKGGRKEGGKKERKEEGKKEGNITLHHHRDCQWRWWWRWSWSWSWSWSWWWWWW